MIGYFLVRYNFAMFMGDLFEIRGKRYGGRLGSTLSVGPNIRLMPVYFVTDIVLS